jgi:hypothetical protein
MRSNVAAPTTESRIQGCVSNYDNVLHESGGSLEEEEIELGEEQRKSIDFL